MEGLLDLIGYLLDTFPAKNKAEYILQLMVEKIRIKIRNRLDSYNAKDRYSVKLQAEEALSFELWFSQIPLALLSVNYRYELNVANHIITDIDKIYGRNFKTDPRARRLASASPGR